MARELVWLEDGTFSAWGCEACGWIMSGSRFTYSENPSSEVKEAFNQHECDKYPRGIKQI